MSLRHLLRRSSTTTIRFPNPISHIQQRFFNKENQDTPILHPQFPLTSERRRDKLRLRIEPSLHAPPSMTYPQATPHTHKRSPSSTPIPTPSQKRMILSKLKASSESCDDLLSEIEEKGGFQISKSDLNRWAKLFEKQGQTQKYIEISCFMDSKYLQLINNYRTNSNFCGRFSNFCGRFSLKTVAAIIAPSVVNLSTAQGLYGSGIIFGERGTILTCAHTVLDLDKVRASPVYNAERKAVSIKLSSGQMVYGTVSDYDLDYDLALVKIESAMVSVSPAKFGSSKDLSVGDIVLSVGNPLGYTNTFSMGTISCVKRTKGEIGLEGKCNVYLQTNCWLEKGSAGGPIVNLEGEVIGLNCGVGVGQVGIGFAIPIHTVLKAVKGRKW